ncbi:MAG: FAD-dependent thymidylate synthase [Candidatus Gracilibacteria bacterium]
MLKVELIAYTKNPFDIAVASARTCYSSSLVKPHEVTDGQRERVGALIYEAGHHTPFQHPTFVFGISGVSRHFVWSFLHSHPFYNSEQQSQRYVYFDNSESFFVPPFESEGSSGRARVGLGSTGAGALKYDGFKAANLYKNAFALAYEAYERLSELLVEDNFRLMSKLGEIKGQDEKQVRTESEKKAIENARYVLPICAETTLYHTISAITLQRYIRLVNACDTPYEAKVVVDAMMGAVNKEDPILLKMIGETPRMQKDTLEWGAVVAPLKTNGDDFAERFDKELGGRISKLVAYQGNGEILLASAVRDVLGVGSSDLSDGEAIDLVMNPAKNPYHLDTLNSSVHSPLMRALQHVSYTFKKRITHTADSQDQRHRMTPASKPLLSRVHTSRPDYHVPSVVEKNAEAEALYRKTCDMLWSVKDQLIDMGVSSEYAVYILPNALNLRFTQSGNLLGFIHKWRLRTCFNAQKEIYDASMDEISQVAEVHPRIARYLGPPCMTRALGGVHGDMKREGPCPEGAHWCGIQVWKNFPKVRRPF